MWGAIASAAAGLIGSKLQADAQKSINQSNIDQQDKANALSIDLANTAHQREVEDLRAAGLNPILSAGGSGAVTPSISAVRAENPYAGLGNSASSVGRDIAQRMSSQYRLMNQSIELDNAQRDIDVRRSSAQSAAEIAQARLDEKVNNLRNEALSDYLSPAKVSGMRDKHGNLVRDEDGRTVQQVTPDYDLIDKRENELKGYLLDGFKSGLQTQWINNWLAPITGGANAVNSGASAAGAIRNMFKKNYIIRSY